MDKALWKAAAKACMQAYEDTAGYKRIAAPADMPFGGPILVQSGGDLIVAFPGTNPKRLADVKADLEGELTEFRVGDTDCEVHSGFLGVLLEVQDELNKTIAETEHERLIVTGHSAGGGIAMQFASQRMDVGALITFGQPKTGDWEFASAVAALFPQVYMRFIHGADIVPHLGLGTHSGTVVYLDGHGDMFVGVNQPGMPMIPRLDWITDHYMAEYQTEMEKQ